MNKTAIEWTHRPGTTGMTWNPIHAKNSADPKKRTGNFCTKVSPGCTHCYAARINIVRGNGLDYTVPNLAKANFYLDENELAAPVRRQDPATIFVGDMFDLFHDAIPDAYIAQVLRVAFKTPRHTFQFLTKRARRMRKLITAAVNQWGPMPAHLWFGVSAEDCQRAEERIPELQQTPCALRFVSIEPQLEEIPTYFETPEVGPMSWLVPFEGTDPDIPAIDWVICGGESGPGARPFSLKWAQLLMEDCRAAKVAFFMKQVGACPVQEESEWKIKPVLLSCANRHRAPAGFVPLKTYDPKGGQPAEWPEYLRVREFPTVKEAPANVLV